MSLNANNEGIRDNTGLTIRVEPLITVEKLKQTYLFGIVPILDDQGNELSDDVFQTYINNAVSALEHDLDIYITPKSGIVEYKDYYMNDYFEWGYIQLNNIPVISIEKLEMSYMKDDLGNDEVVQEIPYAWIRLKAHDGIIRLIPNNKFPANLQVDSRGNFFPELLRSNFVPNLWKVTYTAGFKDGMIPIALNQAIGLIASIQALILGGNLIAGAGIASQSISIDGLSSSINTTQSAENSGYSATLKEYAALLYGQNAQDRVNSLMNKLRTYYQGETISII